MLESKSIQPQPSRYLVRLGARCRFLRKSRKKTPHTAKSAYERMVAVDGEMFRKVESAKLTSAQTQRQSMKNS
jgi:hypothetical protein